MREYGDDDREIGDEATPDAYVSEMVDVGREVRRVLRDDGTWWLNLGDSYASDTKESGGTGKSTLVGTPNDGNGQLYGARRLSCGVPPKSLLGIPWRVALALQADGWILRAAVPWIKANSMPESVRDRPTVAHEYVFLLTKSPRYFWDADAVRVQWADDRAGWSGAVVSKFSDPGAQRNDGGIVAKTDNTGRNLRTSDFFHAGLDTIEEFAEHAAQVRKEGGLMLSPDGEPLAFMVNPVPNKLAHFAMWPPRLVAPMIKTSTSQHGCCPTCGAPWSRFKERIANGSSKKPDRGFPGSPQSSGGSAWSPVIWKDNGFRPACSCPERDPVPCRVLDPFGGSGTTAQVARALGRDCTLVELMAKNLPIIEERMRENLDERTMKPLRSRPVR